ncbi:hypothetical protein [Microbacterium sp. IEGM 1404]|uniref:hypothetical protein n=1 Tax=Microbacterium sp. IEGM 1404 TaxID=3047084 RepID=UPI0024B6F632|nr:hypothetical protein [Microbacterium sp. IEGM 1404]MDI9889988.1 hypothetical protein [Microbacterium sp. IEGM 1404]
MTLETVTGTLRDFGGGLDLSISPRLVFRPNGAAVGAGGIFFSRPIVVDTFGAGGTWTVQLEGTDALWNIAGMDVWYDVTVDRKVAGADYAPWDHPGWRLKVPPGGGVFSALVSAPTNPAQIWVGPARAIPQGAPGWDTPVQHLKPSTYTGWYKTNALPAEPNYFEWE